MCNGTGFVLKAKLPVRLQHNPLDRWPEFAETIRKRLELGRQAYGDRSFSREPAELVGEVQAELLDVCGWAYVLWVRLEAMRTALAPKAPAPSDSCEHPRERWYADPEYSTVFCGVCHKDVTDLVRPGMAIRIGR